MHTIELRNGSRLAYRDHGKGPVMLLVHGWGVSGELFDEQVSALAGRFRLVVPDLPGHGASGEFTAGSAFASLADSLAELIATLKLDRICLLGWSLGAMVAWDLLQRHPESDIAALVTVDMVPRLLNDAEWTFGLRAGTDHHAFDREIELIETDWPAYVELLAPRLSNPTAAGSAPSLMTRIKHSAINNHAASMARIWSLMVEQDFRTFLPKISIPTLVVSGRQSALYRVPAGEWVAGQIPAARFELFTRSGHAPHLDEPQRFNQLLADFALKSFEPTASGRTGNQAT